MIGKRKLEFDRDKYKEFNFLVEAMSVLIFRVRFDSEAKELTAKSKKLKKKQNKKTFLFHYPALKWN